MKPIPDGNLTAQTIRILLADADDSHRERLRAVIAAHPDLEMVGTAIDGERAVRLAMQLQPDVAILDASLPRMDGIAAAERIAVETPECQIIVISAKRDMETMRRAMVAGAREFLAKPADGNETVQTVRRLVEMEQRKRRARLPGAEEGGNARTPRRQQLGQVISVCGPKGGVGRTVLAVNLALSILQKTGRKVLLIDGCFGFGNVDVLLDLVAGKSILDLLVEQEQDLEPDLINHVVVHHPSGLDVLLAPPGESTLLIQPTHLQTLFKVLQRLYDHIVVDARAVLDDETLTLLDLSDKILLVTTPELTALRNLRIFLEAADRLGYGPAKLMLIVNRADMRNAISSADIEKACRVHIAASLPNDHEAVADSVNRGRPLVVHVPQRPIAREIANLATRLTGKAAETGVPALGPRTVRLGRLLGRLAGSS